MSHPKKHESIEVRLTIEEKRRIQALMPKGEMSDVIRSLLMMYTSNEELRQQVHIYRLTQTQGWQQP